MRETIAALFCLGLLALVVGLVIYRLSRSTFSPLQSVMWCGAQLLTKFLWRARRSGPFPLPDGQGAVVVCNHRSSVDPFFVQVATGRKVHWMVAREYVEHPAFGPLLRACEVIPANRGGMDIGAVKAAIRLTSAGGLLGMFPEGRINMTEELMLPGRPGAAWIALKSRCLVLPCYIEGSPYRRTPWSPFLMTARVTVRFGQPLDFSEYFGREGEDGVLAEVLHRCQKAIAELAGQPDFEPRIAGRNWKPTAEELAADMDAADQRRREK